MIIRNNFIQKIVSIKPSPSSRVLKIMSTAGQKEDSNHVQLDSLIRASFLKSKLIHQEPVAGDDRLIEGA